MQPRIGLLLRGESASPSPSDVEVKTTEQVKTTVIGA